MDPLNFGPYPHDVQRLKTNLVGIQATADLGHSPGMKESRSVPREVVPFTEIVTQINVPTGATYSSLKRPEARHAPIPCMDAPCLER